VFSTAGDLVIWNDALTNNRLGSFVSEKIQEPATLTNGRKLSYARGLFLDSYRGTPEVWHSGSADGYKSWLGRFPEHGLSIAIMCNSGDETDRRSFAHRIFDVFVSAAGDQQEEEEGPPPVVPKGIDMSGRTGLFFKKKNGEPIRLAMDRGRFRVAGGPGLVAIDGDHFRRWGERLDFMSGEAFELNFESADQFELKFKDGTVTQYRRARSFAPTPEELQAFAGRYANDEIGSIFGIEPQEIGLKMRLEHSPDKALELKPVDPDTFQFSRITVRFCRDETGKVVALEYSNPMLRNIKFTRLGGG